MRGLLSALNLFSQAIAYAVGLATAAVVKDPYLTWDFGAPAIIGLVSAAFFWWMYKDIDKEEYKLSTNDDYHLENSESDVGEEPHKDSLIDEKTKAHDVKNSPIVEENPGYTKEIS